MKLNRRHRVYITFSLLILCAGIMIYLMRPSVIDSFCDMKCINDKKKKLEAEAKKKAEAEAAKARAKAEAEAAKARAEAEAAKAKAEAAKAKAKAEAEAAKAKATEAAKAEAAKAAEASKDVAKGASSGIDGIKEVGNNIGSEITKVAKDTGLVGLSACPKKLADVALLATNMGLIAKNWGNMFNIRCLNSWTRSLFTDHCEIEAYNKFKDKLNDIKKEYSVCFPKLPT